jgi:hypothetical protein
MSIISRRSFILRSAGTTLALAAIPRAGLSQSSSQRFDYYIGPSGSDSNAGTQASPWAITALTDASPSYRKIAGKRIGLLDGHYDVSGFGPQKSGNFVRLCVPGGSAASPTVIQSVNPRMAVISGKSGTTYPGQGVLIGNGANGQGAHTDFAYITLKDLTVTGCYGTAVSFCGVSADERNCVGIVVDGCHVYDVMNRNASANCAGVEFGNGGVSGALVHNCVIHDCYCVGYAPRNLENCYAILDYAQHTTVEYCTLYNAHALIRQKNNVGPPFGMTIRFNYLYAGPGGANAALVGFNNAYGTSPPYPATNVHNNIFETIPIYYSANSGEDGFHADWNFFNNTIYLDGIAGCVGPFISAAPSLCSVRYYNNFHVRRNAKPGGSGRGDAQFGSQPNAWTIIDFNRWEADSRFGVSANPHAYPTSLLSFEQWRGIKTSPSPDAHSSTSAAKFASNIIGGAGAQQYKLASGSTWASAGRVGGVAQGGPVELGAWGGGATQIGAGFLSEATGPPALPTIKVR